jgi:1,4-alpha-glucan branching enzyme
MVHHHADGTLEFEYFRPTAASVELLGDFNGWETSGLHMTRDKRGWWRLRMAMAEGDHRFSYLVNGETREADFAAYGVEANRLGGWNSVIFVDRANLRKVAVA